MVLTFALITDGNTGDEEQDNKLRPSQQSHPAPPAPIKQEPPGHLNNMFAA